MALSAVVADRGSEGARGSAQPTSAPAIADSRPHRLAGLDGIRGLAALFVVVDHVFLRAFPGYPVDHAPFWAGWFIYGRFAVVIFIVLSGFSLALSPARHGWRLDGVSRFAQRRAWRILPAYWAALVFSLAVALLLVASDAAFATSCTANTTEGCLAGPCSGLGGAGSSATRTTTRNLSCRIWTNSCAACPS